MSCDCEPFTIEYDDGEQDTIDHEGGCPRCWDHLHTAEDILNIRRCIMLWSAEGRSPTVVHDMAAGITARAVELGVETP